MKPPPARCDRINCPVKRAHDTYSALRAGCRSPAAYADDHRYKKLLRAGLHPHACRPIGPTARRLQALAAIGWDNVTLSRRTGIDAPSLRRLTRGTEQKWVERRTARAVDAVFRELSITPGPSTRVRAQAARKQWYVAGAFDDIDDMDEEPKLGRRPNRDVDERTEVTRRLMAGHSVRQNTWDLGTNQRTVERRRDALAAATPTQEATAS